MIVDRDKCERMVTAARINGLDVTAEWLDDTGNSAWLKDYADVFGVNDHTHVMGVDDGDARLWFMKMGNAWSLMAIAPKASCDGDVLPRSSFFKSKWPEDWITPKRAVNIKPITPVIVNAWVGASLFDGSGQFGRAITCTKHGAVQLVLLAEGGELMEADRLARRWFPFDGRSEALQSYWDEGKTTFGSYMGMIGALARRQKKLTKGA